MHEKDLSIRIDIEINSVHELDRLRKYVVALCHGDEARLNQLIEELNSATVNLKAAEDTANKE